MKGLSSEEACEEIVVPGRAPPPEAQRVLAGRHLDKIVSQVLEGGEVGGSVIGSDTALIVVEVHVEDQCKPFSIAH